MATNGTLTMSKPKAMKSFKVSCPQCSASDSITLDLNDLTNVTCGECQDSFSPETARKKLAEELRRWDAIIAWIALAGDVMADTDSAE